MAASLINFIAQTSLPPLLQHVVLRFCAPQKSVVVLRAFGSGAKAETYYGKPGDRVVDLYMTYQKEYTFLDRNGDVLHPTKPLTSSIDIYVLQKDWQAIYSDIGLTLPETPQFAFYAGCQKRDRDWSHSPCGKWRGQIRGTGDDKYVVVETMDTEKEVLQTEKVGYLDIFDYCFFHDKLFITHRVGATYYCLNTGKKFPCDLDYACLSTYNGLLFNFSYGEWAAFDQHLHQLMRRTGGGIAIFGSFIQLSRLYPRHFCPLEALFEVAKLMITQPPSSSLDDGCAYPSFDGADDDDW